MNVNVDINIDNKSLQSPSPPSETPINNIISQLELLDYYFYENIDSGLIQHPDLCKFASNMENIKSNILNTLNTLNTLEHIKNIQKEHTLDNKNENKSIHQFPNINYSQLQGLSNSKLH